MLLKSIVESESPTVESFEGFYKRVWDQIHRAVAVGTGDSDLASEAVDEAMARAYERRIKVMSMNNPEGWVYTTAMTWARSRLRRRKFRSNSRVPEIPVDHREVADPGLLDAIRQLPFHQREAVVGRYLLDMSEAKMSESFNVPKGTIKSRLHRALEALRKELS